MAVRLKCREESGRGETEETEEDYLHQVERHVSTVESLP